MIDPHTIKRIIWIGSSLRDLKSFPDEVKDVIGYALYQAQIGRKAHSAKPLSGFGGARVLEVIEDHLTDTYRVVYTVKFGGLFTCCTHFRRNRRKAALLQNPISISSINDLRVAEKDYKMCQAGRRER